MLLVNLVWRRCVRYAGGPETTVKINIYTPLITETHVYSHVTHKPYPSPLHITSLFIRPIS